MATIIRFAIPSIISDKLSSYDQNKIVNAVQAELNSGIVLKASSRQQQDWKTVKDDEGNERMVIVATTKAGEKLQLENGIGNRFYAWCSQMSRLQTFGATEFSIPAVYVKWLDGFAKK